MKVEVEEHLNNFMFELQEEVDMADEEQGPPLLDATSFVMFLPPVLKTLLLIFLLVLLLSPLAHLLKLILLNLSCPWEKVC
jgi:hypothetical protein